MTENEAIELHIGENLHRISVVEEFLRMNPDRDDKECKKTIQILTKTNGVLEEIQQYRKIGTVSGCQKAMEKQKAEKVRYVNCHPVCPECDCELRAWYRFCPDCGQAIIIERNE